MRSRSATRTLSAALLIGGVMAGALHGQEIRKEGRYYVGEIVRTFKVSPGGTLRLIDVRGDVRVTGAETEQVTVHQEMRLDVYTEEEARTAIERAKTNYRVDDNVVAVRGSEDAREWIRSTFRIEVPRDFNVEVETSAGDIELSGIRGRADLETAGGDITLREVGGDVLAKTSAGSIDAGNLSGDADLRTSGGDIELRDISGTVDARTAGGDVVLRGAKKTARLKTSGGDIDVRDVVDVTAATSGGDVVIRNAKGSVDARTSGGDIELVDCAGPVTANTAGGGIRASRVGAGVQVRTAGGDIDLEEIRGSIEARTAGGNISASMTLSDFSQDHHVTMITAGGNLTLALPAKIPATVEAEIRMERWGEYTIRSDFPLTTTEEEESERGRRGYRYLRAAGELNGGGDLIRLQTTNGDIVIRKR